MRVTRESLVRIAKETAQERAFNDQSIVAAYLTGSLRSEADPMLGGTTDVDLVLVHSSQPGVRRQIVKLTPDFHLDVRHRAKAEFKSPRELRTDPYLGWELYDPLLLVEREKFFEFAQAGLRAGFEFQAPAPMLVRCRTLLAQARKAWLDLSGTHSESAGPPEVAQFLRALGAAANTVAELNGGPLAERRFLLEFPARAQAADCGSCVATVFNLLGAGEVDAALLSSWISSWRASFLAAAESSRVDSRIHAARLNYYEKAIQALLAGESPLAALWPLLNTWTLSVSVLDEPARKEWSEACEKLGLLAPSLDERIAGLDDYLDELEIRLDQLATANGLETSTSL